MELHMPQIKVTKPFKFAHRGVEIEEFLPSDEPRDTTDEVAAWVVDNGYGKRIRGGAATNANAAAPENKDAAGQGEIKA
jgi:hypothetical protein